MKEIRVTVALAKLVLRTFLILGKRPAPPVKAAEVAGAARPGWVRQWPAL